MPSLFALAQVVASIAEGGREAGMTELQIADVTAKWKFVEVTIRVARGGSKKLPHTAAVGPLHSFLDLAVLLCIVSFRKFIFSRVLQTDL